MLFGLQPGPMKGIQFEHYKINQFFVCFVCFVCFVVPEFLPRNTRNTRKEKLKFSNWHFACCLVCNQVTGKVPGSHHTVNHFSCVSCVSWLILCISWLIFIFDDQEADEFEVVQAGDFVFQRGGSAFGEEAVDITLFFLGDDGFDCTA